MHRGPMMNRGPGFAYIPDKPDPDARAPLPPSADHLAVRWLLVATEHVKAYEVFGRTTEVLKPFLDDFTCPLRLEVFYSPVVAADGLVYEHEAALKSFASLGVKSPVHRTPLTTDELYPAVHVTIQMRRVAEALLDDWLPMLHPCVAAKPFVDRVCALLELWKVEREVPKEEPSLEELEQWRAEAFPYMISWECVQDLAAAPDAPGWRLPHAGAFAERTVEYIPAPVGRPSDVILAEMEQRYEYLQAQRRHREARAGLLERAEEAPPSFTPHRLPDGRVEIITNRYFEPVSEEVRAARREAYGRAMSGQLHAEQGSNAVADPDAGWRAQVQDIPPGFQHHLDTLEDFLQHEYQAEPLPSEPPPPAEPARPPSEIEQDLELDVDLIVEQADDVGVTRAQAREAYIRNNGDTVATIWELRGIRERLLPPARRQRSSTSSPLTSAELPELRDDSDSDEAPRLDPPQPHAPMRVRPAEIPDAEGRAGAADHLAQLAVLPDIREALRVALRNEDRRQWAEERTHWDPDEMEEVD